MEGKKVDTKLLLFTLVLVLISLLLLNWFLGGNRTDKIWNYQQITSATDIIYLGEKHEDRQTYYILENIVTEYLNSYLDVEYEEENKLNYKQYYRYLTQSYKDYLSQKEYNAIAEKFLNKFYVNVGNEYEVSEFMDDNKVIQSIYAFENNVYLCKLIGEYTGNTGYIAIALGVRNNAYNIVYIE